MTNGVYELMDAHPQFDENGFDNDALPPEPEQESGLVRFLAWATYWRVWTLLAGILAAIVAFYIFYFQPWLGWSSQWDGWLANNRCLFDSLCKRENFNVPHHVGLVALLGALILLGITLQKPIDQWFPGYPSRRRFINPNYVPILITLGLLCIGYQIYQIFSQTAVSTTPWLLGLFFFGLAALLWDGRETDSIPYTMTNLALGVGSVLTIIGLAGSTTGNPMAIGLLIIGVLLFLIGNLQLNRLDSHFELTDYIIMFTLAIITLFLGLLRVWDWQYAFIGDEWGFFHYAQDLIHKDLNHSPFFIHDSNGYHTTFSSLLQSSILQVAGEDVFGWRLSSILPIVLSVPALYIFLRWLMPGRNAAALGAGLLGVSHVLLSFSMVAYNNTQALLPLTLGLATFAFARWRFSATRYLLLGVFLGLGFLVYGLGRLAIIPLAILIFLYIRDSLHRLTLARVFIGFGFVSMAAPILFSLDNWLSLLKATPAQSETGSFTATQLINNILSGFKAFITSDHNTHFVAGPHLDPLTACLMVIGIGYILFTFIKNHRILSWLGAALLFWIAVSAIQQYDHVATTRMFILIPIYASFAGIGGAALIQQLIAPSFPRVQLLFVTLFLVIAATLNQLHIQNISSDKIRWKPPTVLLQQIHKSQTADQSGVPIYVVWNSFPNPLESTVLNAYNVSIERVRFINGDEALSVANICQDNLTSPKMLLLHSNHDQTGEIDRHLRDCWPEVKVAGIHDDKGERIFYRYLNSAAQQEFALPMDQRRSYRLDPDHLAVKQPKDIALSGVGNLYVLSTHSSVLSSSPTVQVFLPDGSLKEQITLSQERPQAIEITPDGLLLVAALDGGAKLTWYDTQGQPVRTSQIDLGELNDLIVNGSGQIFASSINQAQVYQLSETGEIEQVFSGEERLIRPSKLAFNRDDDSLWILHNNGNNLLKLSAEDKVVEEIDLSATLSEPSAAFMVEPSGTILLTQPSNQRVVRLDTEQELLDLWSGFKRPLALETNSRNHLYVMDPDMGKVHIIALSSATTAAPISPKPTPTEQPASPLNTPEPPSSDVEEEENTSASDDESTEEADVTETATPESTEAETSEDEEGTEEESSDADESTEDVEDIETSESADAEITEGEATSDGGDEVSTEEESSDADESTEDVDASETATPESAEAEDTEDEAASDEEDEESTEEKNSDADESTEDVDASETATPESAEAEDTEDEAASDEEDNVEEEFSDADESDSDDTEDEISDDAPARETTRETVEDVAEIAENMAEIAENVAEIIAENMAEIAEGGALEAVSPEVDEDGEELDDIESDDADVPYDQVDDEEEQPDSPLLTDEEKEQLSQPVSPLESGE